MKIIKNGFPMAKDGDIRFYCRHCGCIFEATKDEYRFDCGYSDYYYICECPQCHTVVDASTPYNREDMQRFEFDECEEYLL